MSVDAASLVKWFQQRPKWLQEAARRLLVHDRLNEEDIKTLTSICRQEAESLTLEKTTPLPVSAFEKVPTLQTLRLLSISEVKGIEALGPKAPLVLGEKPLTIVYGPNGAGKSGYIRILNNLCGSKNQRRLIGNVFEPPGKASCKVSYSLDQLEKSISWEPQQGQHSDLSGIEIYDAESGHVYVTADNEVAFEPWLLGYFQRLVELCDLVSERLSQDINALLSKKPVMPPQWTTTGAAKWYATLGARTSAQDVAHWCEWPKERQDALDALNARLLQPEPKKEAKKLRDAKVALANFSTELISMKEKMGDGTLVDLVSSKSDAALKRQAASQDAERLFAEMPLKGVGLDSWKLLWEQARAYSEAVAYKGHDFPHTGEAALCVLCQQPLAAEAKSRFISFESFVKGALESLAKSAEERVKSLLDSLPQVTSTADFESQLLALGLADEATGKPYRHFRDGLQKRRDALLDAVVVKDVHPEPDINLLTDVAVRMASLEEQASSLDQDSNEPQKTDVRSQSMDLEARRWLSQQRVSVEAEIQRLKSIATLREAQKLAITTHLSSKKSEVAQLVISQAFISRFIEELKRLNATRIQVELVQSHAAKGRVYHRIQLKNAQIKAEPETVLSEGERRIVSLAVFLADVEGADANTPFVFDDPISSLDQDYEESVVARLVTLAGKRQVIVFTHRISLVVMLHEAADSAAVDTKVVALQREEWGAGEPCEPPLEVLKPQSAISGLVDRVKRAQRSLQEKGKSEYENQATLACRETRILIERLVEDTLLSNVVRRFRRGVQTYNKIMSLGKITKQDCKLIDDMMTKFSRYEHSQPFETPVAIPMPDELLEDLNRLRDWASEFSKRKVET